MGITYLLVNGIYGGYNPLTNHLLTSWNIQAPINQLADLRRVTKPQTAAVVVAIAGTMRPATNLTWMNVDGWDGLMVLKQVTHLVAKNGHKWDPWKHGRNSREKEW